VKIAKTKAETPVDEYIPSTSPLLIAEVRLQIES
jgi:hypothetical protein